MAGCVKRGRSAGFRGTDRGLGQALRGDDVGARLRGDDVGGVRRDACACTGREVGVAWLRLDQSWCWVPAFGSGMTLGSALRGDDVEGADSEGPCACDVQGDRGGWGVAGPRPGAAGSPPARG